MSGEGKVVCVTGASGYIASWIVKLLLLRGYTVNATVREPNDPKKTENLLTLDGAKERLHLFKANLMEEGSFDPAIDGCEAVFHTASPVLFSSDEPQAELIGPAVEGTINVLKSCAKTPSIKRVILTSSLVTLEYNAKPPIPDEVIDETWQSDLAFCESYKLWYIISKVLAEEAAWKFAKENGIDLVTMNPGLVIGPFLQPTLNLTLKMFLNKITGAEAYFPESYYGFVDIRDVATAHIQAFEIPSASGRYCIAGKVAKLSEVLKIVHDLYPTLLPLDKIEQNKPLMPKREVSKEKAKTLGIEFTDLEVTAKDTIESLMEKGFLSV